jgi:hypothetical protein
LKIEFLCSERERNCFEDPRINFMDYVAILCRFNSPKELLEKFQTIIQKGLEEGNLEVITLIGLKSHLTPMVL